jgi:hypothetical protein
MPVRRPHLFLCLIVMLVAMMSGTAAARADTGVPSEKSLTDSVQDGGGCIDHGDASRMRCCSAAHCLTALITILPNVLELYPSLIVGRSAETEFASRTPACPDRPPKA